MSRHEELKSQGAVGAALGALSLPTNGEAPKAGRADMRNWMRWAEKHVSGEYAPFAAQAAAMLVYHGKPVTVGAVRARLKATGRDAKSLGLVDAA